MTNPVLSWAVPIAMFLLALFSFVGAMSMAKFLLRGEVIE